MKSWVLRSIAVVLLFSASWAQAYVTYDVSGTSGTQEGKTYSEAHLGLNWHVSDWFNWRNSVFSRFGTDFPTVYGLDTEALFKLEAYTQKRNLGVEFYIGPGARIASEQYNAGFGKAGITFQLAGIRIGGGVQALHYLEDRFDNEGNLLKQDEVQTFITLSGGGTF
ncbi:hypothetical protein BDW_11155 [Bdellovibrio bacteriovorus W]|nr:hypothetical protein BDW_11155 [Bdellovibrio bacteriovorus W]